ncbi:uncharacterized protein TNCV_1523991 [Trichonephila clavipes]|nr:uncharacterized protein TNCV_1523991 [Trichonephila clavipes]
MIVTYPSVTFIQVHSLAKRAYRSYDFKNQTLYRKDIEKVELHMDKASGHTTKSIAAYFAKKESETGIKCIPFDETHVKSPYTSAMDFCAFVLLKLALGKRHPRTLNELRKGLKLNKVKFARQY